MQCPGCQTEMIFDKFREAHKCPVCKTILRDNNAEDPIEKMKKEQEKND